MLFRGYKVGKHHKKGFRMHYDPLTGQQAIEKLERAEPTRRKLSVGEFLLGKLTISEIFRLLPVSSGQ